jgi:type I restriction enzyme, S subunit
MRWTAYSPVQSIPDNWQEESLAALSQRRRGYSWGKEQETSAAESGGVPVIRIPNVGDELNLSDLLHLRNVSPQDLAEFAVEKDWILYVASNGNPDRIGDSIFLRSDERMLFASFLQAITTKDHEKILPEFLARWLRLHRVHEVFSKCSQQTTGLANFSWSAVKGLPVRFPVDVGEQQAILATLRLVDDATRACKAELEKACRLKSALLQQLFTKGIAGRHQRFKKTRIGEIPERWDVRTIRCVLAEPPFSGVSPESRADPPGTPILNVSCVKSGRCDPAAITYVDADRATIDECLARKGDFFVLRGNGNREYVATGGLSQPCDPEANPGSTGPG